MNSDARGRTWRWRGANALALLCGVILATGTAPANADTASSTPACASLPISVRLDVLVPATIHGTLCHPPATTPHAADQSIGVRCDVWQRLLKR